MEITFSALGLNFEATVNHSIGRPGTHWEPKEYPVTEIIALYCEGKECLFLLDSTVSESIEDAASEAAIQYIREEREEAACSRAEQRREEAMHQ